MPCLPSLLKRNHPMNITKKKKKRSNAILSITANHDDKTNYGYEITFKSLNKQLMTRNYIIG